MLPQLEPGSCAITLDAHLLPMLEPGSVRTSMAKSNINGTLQAKTHAVLADKSGFETNASPHELEEMRREFPQPVAKFCHFLGTLP
jgi:hypothetical protein